MSDASNQTNSPFVVEPGLVLAGRYKLSGPIAAGGMAQVWRGYDEILDRNVAVKILHAHLAHDDKGFVTRFRREAVAAARLSHESIVSIYDTISSKNLEAIVMELIEGKTLRTLLNEQPTLEAKEIARIGVHICEALAEAHRYGIVHRDIKPANIIMGPERVMVTDFGIAKAGDDIDLTATGTLLGTAKYLAPEQVLGEKIDPRSDLYSLGIVLYEAATGTVPFLADTDAATALKRLHRDPPRARSINSEVPRSLERVLDRALARDAEDRFRRAKEFKQALEELITADDENIDRKSGENTAEFNPFTTTQPSLTGRSRPPRTGGKSTRKPPTGKTRPVGDRKPRSRTRPRGEPARRQGSNSNVAGKKGSGIRDSRRRGEGRPQKQASKPSTSPANSSETNDHETRSWSVPAIAVLAIITGIAIAIALLTRSGGSTPTEEATAEPTDILNVTDFDPLGDGREKAEIKSNAIDSELTSYWETEPYRGPNFGNGLKQGVGLLLEIEKQEIAEIEINSATTGWSMDIFVGESFGDVPAEWGDPAASITSASGTVKETFGEAEPEGSKVLLWITDHGSTDGRYLFRLNEVIISN